MGLLVAVVVLLVLASPFVVLAIVLITASRRRARERQQATAAWAAARGWTWRPADPTLPRRFLGPPFGRGSGRLATNVVQGTVNGRAVLAFDYRYTVHSGSGENSSSTTYTFSVVALSMPAAVPTLQVGYEGGLTGAAHALGIHDIELESEAFNRTFLVGCRDRRLAYDVLHPRLMQWLLATHGPAWRMERADILCWHSGRVGPAVLDADLAYLDAIVAQVPDFVWHRAGQLQ